MVKQKIAIVTATRAEYGLLSHLIFLVHQHPQMDLQLYVTGGHLVPEQGLTVEAIRASQVPITAEVPIVEAGGSMAEVTAKATGAFAQQFAMHQPDWVVVLGDRYEMLGVATAALLSNIPIAHLHGGEITEGAVDDAIRHAISKMASLHFVAAEPYAQRLKQMGEASERIFNVGAMGLDAIHHTPLLSSSELAKDLGLSLTAPLLLITYHPETWAEQSLDQSLTALFQALEAFSQQHPSTTILWTGANLDAEGQQINQQVQDWGNQQKWANFKFVPSLGLQRYLSAMKMADIVVGNSSSGIIEAPAMKTPTLNIGQRQAGRLMADSILQTPAEANKIRQALESALAYRFPADFQMPYGSGESAKKVVDTLSNYPLQKALPKPFIDLRKH